MAPDILLRTEPPEAIETPLLALALAEGALPRSLSPLDDATGGALARPIAARDFRGKKDESLLKSWEADLRRREEELKRQEQERGEKGGQAEKREKKDGEEA